MPPSPALWRDWILVVYTSGMVWPSRHFLYIWSLEVVEPMFLHTDDFSHCQYFMHIELIWPKPFNVACSYAGYIGAFVRHSWSFFDCCGWPALCDCCTGPAVVGVWVPEGDALFPVLCCPVLLKGIPLSSGCCRLFCLLVCCVHSVCVCCTSFCC